MGIQHKISQPMELLNEKGHLIEPGYATKPFWNYNREKIDAGWHRIKEWDYYYILNKDFGITFTISDLGYIGLIAVAWLDFKKKHLLSLTLWFFYLKEKWDFHLAQLKEILSFQIRKSS